MEDKKTVHRDTKPANIPPPAAPAPTPPVIDMTKPVPVALVRFDRPIQYPGRGSDAQAKTERHTNGQTWTVEFISAHRVFKIVHTDPAKKTVKVGFVPEARALSWEPLEA